MNIRAYMQGYMQKQAVMDASTAPNDSVNTLEDPASTPRRMDINKGIKTEPELPNTGLSTKNNFKTLKTPPGVAHSSAMNGGAICNQ